VINVVIVHSEDWRGVLATYEKLLIQDCSLNGYNYDICQCADKQYHTSLNIKQLWSTQSIYWNNAWLKYIFCTSWVGTKYNGLTSGI